MSEAMVTDPAPVKSAVECAVRATLQSMTEAIVAMLATEAPERFGTAARMCSMAQKLSIELVTTVKQAAQIRVCGQADMALGGYMGPEAQYIAQAEMGLGDYAGAIGAIPLRQGPADTVTMQRDMMMMLQGWFEDQKKAREKQEQLADAPDRLDVYAELHKVFAAITALKNIDPHSPGLAILEKKSHALMERIAKGDDDEPIKTDVVPTELLRGHPPGAREQRGDPPDPRGPVLHREGGGEEPPFRMPADRFDQENLGYG